VHNHADFGTMQILKQMEVPFETVDVLSNDMLRQGMKEYSQVCSLF
jgi:glutaredoxin-related protein